MLYEFSDDYTDDEKFVVDEKYKNYKTDTRLVDFDDMIISCNEQLKNDIDFKRYAKPLL